MIRAERADKNKSGRGSDGEDVVSREREDVNDDRSSREWLFLVEEDSLFLRQRKGLYGKVWLVW